MRLKITGYKKNLLLVVCAIAFCISFGWVTGLILTAALYFFIERSGWVLTLNDKASSDDSLVASEVSLERKQALESEREIIEEPQPMTATSEVLVNMIRDATAGFPVYQQYKVEIEAHFPNLMPYLGPITLLRFEDQFSKVMEDGASEEKLKALLSDLLMFNECLISLEEDAASMLLNNGKESHFEDRLAVIESFVSSLSKGVYYEKEAARVFSGIYSHSPETVKSAQSLVADYCSEMNLMDYKYATNDVKERYRKSVECIFSSSQIDEQLGAARSLTEQKILVESVIGDLNNLEILNRCIEVDIHVNGDLDDKPRRNNGSRFDNHFANSRRELFSMDGGASSHIAELHTCYDAWVKGLDKGLSSPALKLIGRRIKALLAASEQRVGGVSAMASAAKIVEQGEEIISYWLQDVSPFLDSDFFTKKLEYYKKTIYEINEGDSIFDYWLEREDNVDYDFKRVWGYVPCGEGSSLSGNVKYSDLVELFNRSADQQDWLGCSFAYIYIVRCIDYMNEYFNRQLVAEAFEASENERIAEIQRQAVEALIEERRLKKVRQHQREMREAAYQQQMLESQWAIASEMENVAAEQRAMRKSQSFNNTLTGLSAAINGLNYLESRKIRKALT